MLLILGVFIKLFVRVLERPFHGPARPWSGWVTVFVCRLALPILGLRGTVTGKPMRSAGIYVANHSSWLDIFVLNAGAPLLFVSKSEVSGWPGIGWLARLTGTVFVRRTRQDAGAQRGVLEEQIRKGHRLLIFPEGTSTDGQRVLPFKTTLFAALFSEEMTDVYVQPVSVAYHAPAERDPRFFAWWGDMEFGPHLLQVLANGRGGRVEVTWHAPLPVSEFKDRKALARDAEVAVRRRHPLGSVEADQ